MLKISNNKDPRKKSKNKIKIFPVPFDLEDIKENITINTYEFSEFIPKNYFTGIKKELSNRSEKLSTIPNENLINKARKFISEGNILEAKRYYDFLLESGIVFPNILIDYSDILIDIGEFYQAEEKLKEAIKINPKCSAAYDNLARVLMKIGKKDKVKLLLEKAISLDPKYANTYNTLGSIFINDGDINKGVNYILNAIKLNPYLAKPYLNLGIILFAIGKSNEAIIHLKKAIELDPNNSVYKTELIFSLSRISELDQIEKLLKSLSNLESRGVAIDPFKLLHLEDNPVNDLRRAMNFYNSNYDFKSTKLTEIKNITKKDKINIAYLSADFKDHPVMHMLAGMFQLHDKAKFNIFIYSFGSEEDDFTDKLKEQGCNYISITDLNIEDAVNLIRNDQIDIAIDLMGYTKRNRMSIFSYRIAPIQINYLGYPSTSGAKSINYLIADKVIIPLENQKYYSEKILYMPNSYMPYSNKTEISKNIFTRKEFGLKDDAFILAAFHSTQKITTKEINSWSRILGRITNATLWISYTNKIAERNIKDQFRKRGIEEGRIIFSKRIESRKDHLSRHSCADLFIDTFNYNGHSTTIDSLWTGLPVVTLMGESFSARVTSSFLSTLNLKQLIASDVKQYEDIVIELANDRKKLANLKNELIVSKKTNPLFDSSRHTRDLECIFQGLVNNYL